MSNLMKIGLFIGIILIIFIGYQIHLTGWDSFYIFMYLCITVLQLISVGEDEGCFNFLTGLNIPTFLIVILIFGLVDYKNKK